MIRIDSLKRWFRIEQQGTKLVMWLTPDDDGQEYGSGLYFGRALTPQEKIDIQEYLTKAAGEWLEQKGLA